MTTTLQEICYNNIANTVAQAPPMIQEMVMGETSERIRRDVRQELREEIRSEILQEQLDVQMHNLVSTIPIMIPEIVDDIIQAMTHQNRLRTNFIQVYAHINPILVQVAIDTAEQTVRSMEDRYINNAFMANNEYHQTHDSDYDSDYDSDGDY